MAASEIAAVSKQIDSLSGIANAYRALEDARKQRLETLGMLETDGKDDAEMREMLQEELAEMDRVIQSREKDLVAELIPRDDVDMADAMLEIRAATGGDEAGLFANEVLKMYERFAQVEGWDFELLSINMEGGNDRLKEGIANISGRGVFGRLKFESGVHRVQRVPQTESKGRVHTSTITVAVMPHASEISSVELRDEDLRIDVFRASGAGGQHVNKTESAVRITHLPSGIAVAVQEERSQHQNKARAMTILKTKLYDIQRAEAAKKRRSTRNSMIGSGTRSEKIRTYNFPQGRVTDHRIGYSTRNIDAIMNATSLGELIDKLRIHYELELLGNAISEQQEQSSSS
ncbi:peptide chain release factor 1 [Ramicandelaber brevisporus]|nr:peptide chain release factor 1 [Ramicandelaber brevisporus]